MSAGVEQHKRLASLLIGALRGADDLEPRSYSGRGMYGARCISVTTHQSEAEVVLSVIAQLRISLAPDADDHFGAMIDLLKGTRSDSMGRERVYYWPSVAWPTDDAKEGGA